VADKIFPCAEIEMILQTVCQMRLTVVNGAMCAGKILEELFKSTSKNMTYKSKTTQNEIIDICGDLITKKITDEIREAKFYSILADEASDCR
jgi:hypothetical protein